MRYKEIKCYSTILDSVTRKGNQFQFTGSPDSVWIQEYGSVDRSCVCDQIGISRIDILPDVLLTTAAAAQRVAYSIRV